ncbi:unnamed protein product [Ilex paraguariensis]|uniref:Protein kinase domain-containing protein n=1 Tax=Ilex paraguariensis TaxID=185542 RepID=A0ABC8V516_9AQUA
MNVSGAIQQKKATPFSPRQSTTTSLCPAKQGRTTTTKSCSWCKGLNDCMVMGSIVPQHEQPQNLEQQVAELEKELQKQKELRALYRLKLERTQDYLRYCLQMAQDNGFLDLLINIKENQQECLLSSSTTSPPMPPLMKHRSDLAPLIDQAKMNGWHIEPHEIELHEKVAQGSTADVYKGTWRGLDVAVKCIYPDFFNSNDNGVNFFAQEVETLSKQRHCFVLQLMGACLNPPDHGWIVTEFLSMTLKEWLHGPGRRQRERIVPLPQLEERLAKALEIAQAMQYLHDHKPKVIHRDLKPSNIFLDDALRVRVADFGHARFLSEGEKALTGETGKDY